MIGAIGVLALLLIVQVSISIRDYWKAEDALYEGLRRYDPEWVVVPPRLVGEPLGTTDREIPFEPYGSDYSYGKPIVDVIPTGTIYYEIEGYSSKTYVAVPYGSNYFLYAHSPRKKLHFSQGEGDAALVAQFAGTPEQAYLETFKYISAYKADFLVLDVTRVSLDDPSDLIALIGQYCDERGSTLIVTSFQTIKGKGYLELDWDSQYVWDFTNGLFIDLEECAIDGDRATVEAGVVAAALAGQGRSCYLEKEDGAWVLVDSMMSWIS